MAPTISLGTYQLFVTHRGDKVVLSDLKPAFLDWCHSVLAQPGLRGIDSEDGARHEADTPTREGTHTIYGRVHSGDSGFGSRLVDAQTGAGAFTRKAKHAELVPFYYQLYAPHGSPLCILVLQKFGQKSPYSFFDDEIRKQFSKAYDGLTLHLQPYIGKAVLSRLQNGIVSEVKFTKFKPPSDLNSFVRTHGLQADDVFFETRMIAKKGRGINLGRQLVRLVEGLTSRNAVDAPAKWKAYGDEIRVKLKHGGRERTLSFGQGREVNPYEDVSERVKRDQDGHPRVDSIHPVANEFVSDIRAELKLNHAD